MSKRGSRFTKEEKLAIVKEGEKTDGKAVCAKYGFSDQAYRVRRYKTGGIQPFGGTFSFRLRDSRLRTLLRPTTELANLTGNVRKQHLRTSVEPRGPHFGVVGPANRNGESFFIPM